MADRLLNPASVLGRPSAFKDRYDPSLLFAIARKDAREKLGLSASLPFAGFDFWTCYELSWQDKAGIPQLAVCSLKIPCNSENLVESKSLKLYLNSFSGSQFLNSAEVSSHIESDLAKVLESELEVSLILPDDWQSLQIQSPHGTSVDNLKPEIIVKSRQSLLLKTENKTAKETLHSNLFRSFCPVTGQPDWASVSINYSGNKIDAKSLLAYIISLQNHQGFHEECCELIFMDILETCRPQMLSVTLNFTRRGGIEINPARYTLGFVEAVEPVRLARQ